MGKEVHTAGGKGTTSVRFDPDLNVVKCKGLAIDEISQLGPIFARDLGLKPEEEQTNTLAWEQQTRHWLFNSWTRANPERHLQLARPANSAQRYADQNVLEEVYIRTLLGDNLAQSNNTKMEQKAAYQTLSVTRQGLDLGFGVPITSLFRNAVSYASWEKMHFNFLAQIGSIAGGRRLCITRCGSLSFCPARAKAGDVVVILLGAVAPFVMRQNNDFFVLLGDGYIDGVTNGEALLGPVAPIQDIVIK
jgi:hypothetical protein